MEEPDDEQEFEEEDNGEGYVIGSYSRDGQVHIKNKQNFLILINIFF